MTKQEKTQWMIDQGQCPKCKEPALETIWDKETEELMDIICMDCKWSDRFDS